MGPSILSSYLCERVGSIQSNPCIQSYVFLWCVYVWAEKAVSKSDLDFDTHETTLLLRAKPPHMQYNRKIWCGPKIYFYPSIHPPRSRRRTAHICMHAYPNILWRRNAVGSCGDWEVEKKERSEFNQESKISEAWKIPEAIYFFVPPSKRHFLTGKVKYSQSVWCMVWTSSLNQTIPLHINYTQSLPHTRSCKILWVLRQVDDGEKRWLSFLTNSPHNYQSPSKSYKFTIRRQNLEKNTFSLAAFSYK